MHRSASWLGCLFVALTIYSFPAGAQGTTPTGTAAAHPRHGTKLPVAAGDWNLFSGIELTEDQQQRIRAVFEARRQQLFLLFEKGRHPANRSAMANSIALVQRTQLADMRSVLTPVQQARFDLNLAAILARTRQVRATSGNNDR